MRRALSRRRAAADGRRCGPAACLEREELIRAVAQIDADALRLLGTLEKMGMREDVPTVVHLRDMLGGWSARLMTSAVDAAVAGTAYRRVLGEYAAGRVTGTPVPEGDSRM